ncbi:GntR family transcriptional regulator [Streptomyces sp. ISL-90]|nr:GntR family transcriptional regulator [Streptomyces sp. ISL-90]
MAGMVQRPVSLGTQVADILRQRIVRGELKPGERLTEEALAEEFNVSRGPVRDAITQLNFEKLVRVQRPRGVYIVGLTDDDVEQLYSLRSALEQLALRRAIRVKDDAPWHPSQECVERMRRAADDRDPAEFARADLEFHAHLYDLADHPRLQAAWQQYMPTFAALLEVTINHDEDLHESADDHRKLYEVIRSGDIAAAARMLEEHLAGAEERMSLELAARSE